MSKDALQAALEFAQADAGSDVARKASTGAVDGWEVRKKTGTAARFKMVYRGTRPAARARYESERDQLFRSDEGGKIELRKPSGDLSARAISHGKPTRKI